MKTTRHVGGMMEFPEFEEGRDDDEERCDWVDPKMPKMFPNPSP